MEGLTPFQKLIDLVKFDREAITLNQNISAAKKDLDLLVKQKEELLVSQETAKKNLLNFEKEVHLQELRMKELQEKESAKKELLAQLANPKEQQALKKEIDALNRSQQIYETDLVNSWNKLETAKKDFENINKSLHSKSQELETAVSEKLALITSLEEKATQHKTARTEKTESIPAEWLQKYNTMYLQVDNPIVPLVGQGCSACFSDVTRQAYIDLQKKKLLQCKGCFRLIYIES